MVKITPAAILSALVALASLFAGAVLADEVVLANGDRITGSVVRKEENSLVMSTSYAGELTIKWSEIRRITTQEPIRLYFEDGSKTIGTLHSEEDGSVIVTVEQAQPSAPIALAKVRFINPSAEMSGEGAKITGHINAGLSSSSGNSQAKKFYADTEGIVRTRDNRATLGARGAHTEDHGVETESNWFAYLKYDHFFTKKWYGYANGDLENDRFKDISLRSTVGLGSGYQFWETPKTNLSLEGGLTYVHTDFIFAPTESYPAARWAMKFDHLLFNTRIQFFHTDETIVSLADSDKIFVRSQTGLRIPLMDRLNATAQYNVDWDNTPTEGRVKTDKALLLTLGYTW